MAFRRPNVGESYADYRAAMQAASANGGVEPATGFEAAKARVAEKQKAKEAAHATPAKAAINVDNAAETDEAVKQVKKSADPRQIVKPQVSAADDKAWAGRVEHGVKHMKDNYYARKGNVYSHPETGEKVTTDDMREHVSAHMLKGGSDHPALQNWSDPGATPKSAPAVKPAHTTETPGSSHQTSMAAAMQQAGADKTLKPSSTDAKTGQPTYQSTDKSLTITPAIREQNNNANRHYTNDTSVVSGLAPDANDAVAARRRAAQGMKKNGGKAEKAPKAATRPAAPKAVVEEAPGGPNGLWSGQQMARARGFAHIVTGGPSGESMKLSDKPAPAPKASSPAPVANKAPTPATAPAEPEAAQSVKRSRFVSTDSVTREGLSIAKPKLGSEITYGVDKANSPAAKTRQSYQAHIAGGGTQESYWADRDSRKAAKAAPAPAAVVSQPSGNGGTAVTKAPAIPASNYLRDPSLDIRPKAASPAEKKSAPVQPATPAAPVPSRAPVAQNTAINPAQASKAAPASPSKPAPVSSAPQEEAPRGASPARAAAARSESTARGGLHVEGNQGSIEGGIGNVTHNNNYTYNINNTVHGDNYGSIGNIGGGSSGRGGQRGTRPEGSGDSEEGPESRRGNFRLQVNDHVLDVNKRVDRYTGKTGGMGEKMPEAKKPAAPHGAPVQSAGPKPSTPVVNQQQMAGASPGTGTTMNQQQTVNKVSHPASGIGTSSYGQPKTGN